MHSVSRESASPSSDSERLAGATIPHFYIEIRNTISKNPWVIYLCISRINPPIKPTYPTKINDPWASVDMVLPVSMAS